MVALSRSGRTIAAYAAFLLAATGVQAQTWSPLPSYRDSNALDLVLVDAGITRDPGRTTGRSALERINAWVNANISLQTGSTLRQSPGQTIYARSADSLDQAVLKVALLRRFGVTSEALSIRLVGAGETLTAAPGEAVVEIATARGTLTLAPRGKIILSSQRSVAAQASRERGGAKLEELLMTSASQAEPSAVTYIDRALAEAGLAPGQPLTPATLRQLNRWTNHAVRFRSDSSGWALADFFQTPAETLILRAGDCEDYAILKAAMLQRMGLAEDAIVYQPALAGGLFGLGGQGHMVLVVKLPDNAAPIVLDNLFDDPYAAGSHHKVDRAQAMPAFWMNDVLTGRISGPRLSAAPRSTASRLLAI